MRRAGLVSALAVALLVPTAAVARKHQGSGGGVNCGGSGLTSLYCIPLRSVFQFTAPRVEQPCTLLVGYTLEPKVKGLRGRVRLTLQGTGPSDRSIDRVRKPLVSGGRLHYRFRSLVPGSYQLTGWYTGDSTRIPSRHVHRSVVVAGCSAHFTS
jgi:hypothetical protein